MGALDTAVEVVRLAKTAGLNKEAAKQLEEKLSLLAEEVRLLQTENAALMAENEKLREGLKNLPPRSDELSRDTKAMLKFFFDRGKMCRPGKFQNPFSGNRALRIIISTSS